MAPEGINQGVRCLFWALSNKGDHCCSRATLSGLRTLPAPVQTLNEQELDGDEWWGHQQMFVSRDSQRNYWGELRGWHQWKNPQSYKHVDITYQQKYTAAKGRPLLTLCGPFVYCRKDTVSEKDHVGNDSDKNKHRQCKTIMPQINPNAP